MQVWRINSFDPWAAISTLRFRKLADYRSLCAGSNQWCSKRKKAEPLADGKVARPFRLWLLQKPAVAFVPLSERSQSPAQDRRASAAHREPLYGTPPEQPQKQEPQQR